MKKSPGENIDDIFREKLRDGENHVEYRESDWEALEERLNRRGKIIPWTWIGRTAAAALILAAALWLFFSPSAPNVQPVSRVNQSHEAPSVSPKAAVPPPGDTGKSMAMNHQPASSGGAVVHKRNENKAAAPSQQKKKQVSQPPIIRQPVDRFQMPIAAPSPVALAGPAGNSRNLSGLLTGGKEAGSPSVKIAPRSSNWDNFALSLIVSSDLNGAGSFQSSSIGGDVGLMITANLVGRWNISAGAIYAKKPYRIDFDRYNPTGGYRFPGRPDQVHADCRVLDLPLNINYDILQKEDSRISLGAGISSYLMLREEYYMKYATNTGWQSNELEIRNQNRHWFSVVNLQVSYERRIGSNLSVGVQPYLKLPVSAIGYGRVKLESAGIAVRFNWGIPAF